MQMIRENVDLTFSPDFTIKESEEGKHIKIGGTALVEGLSKNKVNYRFQNLKENNGRNFKWLVGHPNKNVEDHVVGKGSLALAENTLIHDGIIMNTARHPDVIEKVKAGLLGPSIHATAKKITSSDEGYLVEGLSIGGVGLVAFQGVKQASIDYAIAESFKDEIEMLSEQDNNEDKGDSKMSEEEVKQPEEVKEVPKEEVKEEVKGSSEAEERIKVLEEEIKSLKNSKKEEIVESIVGINKELKSEDLIKESEEKLIMIKEYEEKLSKITSEAGIVESEEKVEEKPSVVETKDGSATLSESAYNDFNKELMERIR